MVLLPGECVVVSVLLHVVCPVLPASACDNCEFVMITIPLTIISLAVTNIIVYVFLEYVEYKIIVRLLSVTARKSRVIL